MKDLPESAKKAIKEAAQKARHYHFYGYGQAEAAQFEDGAEFGYPLGYKDGYEEAMREVAKYFDAMRHDPNHHLGLGDIRLTYGQQEEITKVSPPSV